MESAQFNTPILFLIFNRPETTTRVFQKIRSIQPRQLFVSADGPRQNKADEDRLCAESRKIIENIDWNCELHTKYSENNLGCRVGVSSGINWFFKYVEEGIILEDDCLPDLSFFTFCEELLSYYRNDRRIMHIGGTNFQDGKQVGSGNYYFSSLCHVWGWATWRRAWSLYDVKMGSYPDCLSKGIMQKMYKDPAIREFWKRNFDLVYEGKIDTWDYQWQYTVNLKNGLAIIPNKNLVSNIGFDHNATHTVDNFHVLANRPAATIKIQKRPLVIAANEQADYYTLRKHMNSSKPRKLLQLIRNYCKRILK